MMVMIDDSDVVVSFLHEGLLGHGVKTMFNCHLELSLFIVVYSYLSKMRSNFLD